MGSSRGNGNQTLRKRKSNFHQPSPVDGHIIRPKVDHVQLQPLEFIVINSFKNTLFIDTAESDYWSVILKNKNKRLLKKILLPPTMRIIQRIQNSWIFYNPKKKNPFP